MYLQYYRYTRHIILIGQVGVYHHREPVVGSLQHPVPPPPPPPESAAPVIPLTPYGDDSITHNRHTLS